MEAVSILQRFQTTSDIPVRINLFKMYLYLVQHMAVFLPSLGYQNLCKQEDRMSHTSLIPSVKFCTSVLNNLLQLSLCQYTATNIPMDTEFHCKLKRICIVKSHCVSLIK